jgi:hypothetical protein
MTCLLTVFFKTKVNTSTQDKLSYLEIRLIQNSDYLANISKGNSPRHAVIIIRLSHLHQSTTYNPSIVVHQDHL